MDLTAGSIVMQSSKPPGHVAPMLHGSDIQRQPAGTSVNLRGSPILLPLQTLVWVLRRGKATGHR
jgi:hypothetical protein